MKKLVEFPLVSIITPALNRSKYLESCLTSILNQSYPHIEHIIVDGGSDDGSVELLSKYSSMYPDRIRFISERDKGAGDAINKGFKMAEGAMLNFLCSDDMLSGTDAIQTVVDFFTSNPDAYFVHGSCEYVNEKGERLRIHKAKNVTLDELVNYRNPIACPSAFYRRSLIETIGGVDDYGNDYDLMIRIAKSFAIHHIEDVLSKFRVHRESETGSFQKLKRVVKLDYIVSRKHGGRLFSHYAIRYYKFLILDFLHLERFYYFMKK